MNFSMYLYCEKIELIFSGNVKIINKLDDNKTYLYGLVDVFAIILMRERERERER